MKKVLLGVLVLTLLLSMVACGNIQTNASGTDEVKINFGTATPGGTYYAMGTGIATCVSEKSNRLSVTAQATGGSAENIRLIQSGELDMGLANGSELYWAWNGEEFFEDQKVDNIRLVSFAWTNTYHFVVLADSDIYTVYDFVGKKVGIGPQGSGAAIFAETFLSAVGIWDEITPVYTPPADQATAIKDGNIDVFGYFSGLPMSSIIDISSTEDIRIIDLKQAGIDSGFEEEYPFYSSTVIPAGTYTGQDEDVNTYANYTYIVAADTVTADVIYEFMDTLFSDEGLEYMLDVHNSARELSVDSISMASDKIGVPMHEGTQQYLNKE